MGAGIKIKLSKDLNLVKKGIEEQMAEVRGNTEHAQGNCAEAMKLQEGLTGLIDKLLGNWRKYLSDKRQLLTDFSCKDLAENTGRGRSFASSFFMRPGMLKIRVTNFIAELLSVIITVLVWVVFLVIAIGLIVLLVYLFVELYDFIVGYFYGEEAPDPSVMPGKK